MKSHRRAVFLIVAINVIVRGFWLLYMHPPQSADFQWYFHHAAKLAAGLGYTWGGHFTAYWPIGWPLILSILFRLTGASLWAGFVLNTVLSIGIVLLIYALSIRITGRLPIAFAAALGYTLLPSQIEWNAVLGSEESFTFVLVLALLLYLFSDRRRWFWWTALAGLVLGLACDIRPIPLLFPFVIILYEWWPTRRRFLDALRRAFVYGLFMAIGVVPVTIRNWLTMHHFIIVSDNGGVNLWQGMHSNNGYFWYWYHNPLLVDGNNEVMENQIGEHLFIQHVLHHPGSVLYNGVLKIMSLYRNDTNATWYTFRAAHEFGQAHLFEQVNNIYYWLFMVVAIIGVVRLLRGHHGSWRNMALILAFILYYTSVFLVFPAWDRFRYPIMPLWAVLFGYAFANWRTAKQSVADSLPSRAPDADRDIGADSDPPPVH